MLKARSTAKTHKSLNRVSDILLRVVVFISFILLNVLLRVVEETGIVMAAMIRNGKRNFKYERFQDEMLSTEISAQEN
jgi:hypothetical protein